MNTTPNIEALQKTQASIADLNYPFHMVGWDACIYFHARRANGWTSGIAETAKRLGVDRSLFYPAKPGGLDDRNSAMAAIQALIDAAQPAPQPEPEPELVCA